MLILMCVLVALSPLLGLVVLRRVELLDWSWHVIFLLGSACFVVLGCLMIFFLLLAISRMGWP